jgi:NADPH-dependent 2,4-dienoyl-CoA reductase/sulfur reductase-like enzyme
MSADQSESAGPDLTQGVDANQLRDGSTLVGHVGDQAVPRFHLSDKVQSISERQVRLELGTMIDADLVVVGIGVKRALELAKTARLALDRRIAVDQFPRDECPRHFRGRRCRALAGSAQRPEIRLEQWIVAERQGQAAALDMLGRKQPFDPAPSSGACTTTCRPRTDALPLRTVAK